MKSLVAGAALFIGNDSGPAHIAAAFGRPVVVLWGSSDLDNWRPWRTENAVLSNANGIQSIEVSEVLERHRDSDPPTRMNELRRLLRYVRPYLAPLLLSVILMALVGAAQGFTALLIGPVFDRVLNPASADSLVPLFTIPLFQHTVYLQDFLPASIHNVWTMVAIAILATFLIKGACDYFGNYLINYVGFSAVTDLAPDRLRQGAAAGRAFFRIQLHRPRDVVHHERSRKDSGGHFAYAGGLAAPELHRARPAVRGASKRTGGSPWSA